MLQNFFKIGVRNLVREKVSSGINIMGLALGIACFILMMTYVFEELSYDKFHKKADRIYRLIYSYEARGATTSVARVAFPVKRHLLGNYPQVEKVVRFYQNNMDATTLKYDDKLYTEENIYFSDSEVFEVFDYPLIKGDPKTALQEMNSIVLTQAAASKYFGDENPMGKIIIYKNRDLLEVTGIVDGNFKSHFDFDFLVPVELQRQRWMNERSNNGYDLEQDWRWSGAWTYILINNAKARASFDQQFFDDGMDLFGRVENTSVDYNFTTQPVLDIHLKSDLVAEIGVNGNIRQVYGFALVGLLILIIASINYINLTTAQSANRAKEIGLRKVMGAHRKHLVGQFISESVLITLLSTFLGIILLEVLIPVFNTFMGSELTVPYLQIPVLIAGIMGGAIFLGILAGAYPSLYLSRFRPIRTLKGNYDSERGNSGLRKILVVVQFIVANILISGIIVVQSQMQFIKGKNLGFEKDQVIVLTHGNKLDESVRDFSSRLTANPRVRGVNQGYVAGTRGWVQSFRIDGEQRREAKSMGLKYISYDFMDLFGLEVVSGRKFSRQFRADTSDAIILNEAAVKALGWSNEEALGKKFSWIGGSDNRTRFECRVVGVMEDANFESLYEPIKPSVFRLATFGDIAIKFEAADRKTLFAAVEEVEDVWNEFMPNWPFEFHFLDQMIAEQYAQDEKLAQMIRFFAFIAIFIACMGLFGLAMFMVQKKTKEIGVRKVLGASAGNIVAIICRGFILLLAISLIISVPIGYFLAGEWLLDFAYRIELTPWIFILSGLISVVVAGVAISSQSLRAAHLDPVNTLRYE